MGPSEIKKISILVDTNMYDVLRHFTQKLAEALKRKGVEVEILDADQKELDTEHLRGLIANPPDFTCSFNTFEKPIWDVLKIPHIAFLVDPALYALDLSKSPYILFSSTDRSDAEALKSICPRTFFLPHAIEADITPGPDAEREYDVVFLGSCFDYEAWRKHWQKELPASLSKMLDEAILMALSNDQITLAEALTEVQHPPEFTEYSLLTFHYLDKYVRGKDRTELIRGIKDATVHVFGKAPDDPIPHAADWGPYLGDQKNVILHPPVSYEESLAILKKSKLCLNSMPFFRDGTHERIFAGLACGALPITSESRYLRETYKHGEDLLYYRSNRWGEVNNLVNQYLADEPLRQKVTASGRAKTMAAHTWDHNAESLLTHAARFLSA